MPRLSLRSSLSVALSLALLAATARAQTAAAPAAAPATTATRVLLWPEGAPGALGTAEKDKPKIDVYLPAADKATGTGVIVCPGGGYSHLSMVNEGSEIARWLNQSGVAAFVLTYRIGATDGYKMPVPLEDAQRAFRLVRSRAAEWGIDPARLGVIGFSAGGHLASTIGTHFDAGKADATDPIDKLSCRPDFLILLYPVISMKPGIMHKGSHDAILGATPDPALEELYSNELQVKKDTPPTFIAHSAADRTVPIMNSIAFYEALVKAGVPGELHVFERGGHGFGLGMTGANRNLPLSAWPKMCEAWLRSHGLLTKGAAAAAPAASAPGAGASPAPATAK